MGKHLPTVLHVAFKFGYHDVIAPFQIEYIGDIAILGIHEIIHHYPKLSVVYRLLHIGVHYCSHKHNHYRILELYIF